MSLLPILFALLPISNEHAIPHPGASVCPQITAPENARSFMVSEDYVEIDWNAIQTSVAYKIQIRKNAAQAVMVLEDKTVWTSFYFRVAEPGAAYEFRLAALSGGVQSAWTEWIALDTTKTDTSTTLAEKNK